MGYKAGNETKVSSSSFQFCHQVCYLYQFCCDEPHSVLFNIVKREHGAGLYGQLKV